MVRKGVQRSLPTANGDPSDRHPTQARGSPQPRAPRTSTMSSHRAPGCRHACQGAGFPGRSSARPPLLPLPPGPPRRPPRSRGRPRSVAGCPSHTRPNTEKQSAKRRRRVKRGGGGPAAGAGRRGLRAEPRGQGWRGGDAPGCNPRRGPRAGRTLPGGSAPIPGLSPAAASSRSARSGRFRDGSGSAARARGPPWRSSRCGTRPWCRAPCHRPLCWGAAGGLSRTPARSLHPRCCPHSGPAGSAGRGRTAPSTVGARRAELGRAGPSRAQACPAADRRWP